MLKSLNETGMADAAIASAIGHALDWQMNQIKLIATRHCAGRGAA